MIMKSRPFEVGDLLVIQKMGFMEDGVLYSDVTKIDCFMKNGLMRCALDDRESTLIYKLDTTLDSNCIKTIRKPRKGNTESRKIVAIAARTAKKECNWYARKYCEFDYWTEIAQLAWNLYQKQKLMLK